MTMRQKKKGFCNGNHGDPSLAKMFDNFANHVIFEYKKALLMFKNRKEIKQFSQKEDVEWNRGSGMECPSLHEYTTLERSGSNLSQIQRRFLSSALSSIPPSPPSSCSSFSSLNVGPGPGPSTLITIYQLPPNCMLMIASFLDGKSVFRLTTTCTVVRNALLENPKMFKSNEQRTSKQMALERCKTRSFDIYVQSNTVISQMNVFVTPTHRSIKSNSFGTLSDRSLSSIMPSNSAISVTAKITFGNNVLFSDFHDDLQNLYREGRLTPTELVFAGGDCTKGKYHSGCDLRCFSESSFMAYLRQFAPHLKSVHLQTSRLFKMTSSPPRILNTISFLSEFGYTYERPALRFFFEDMQRVIENWRHDPSTHSVTLYIRQPKNFCHRFNELNPVDVFTSSLGALQQLCFMHSFISDLKLTLIF